MIFVIIIISIVAIIVVMGIIIVYSFKNNSQKHSSTPKNFGIEFKEVSISTKNNKKLYGWWIASNLDSPTVILMHGWGKNAERLMPYIVNLHGKGLNLLAFDSRNHGNSDSDNFSSMIKFAEDICACIDFIDHIPSIENNNIFLIGLSIGGAASIYAASSDSRIKKIITIGAPSNPEDVMALHISKKRIPKPVIWLIFQLIQYQVGKRFSDISAERNISKTMAYVLLIHGTNDKVVPFSQAEKILKASNPGQTKIWAIKDKGHSNCHYEKGFWDQVISFLEK